MRLNSLSLRHKRRLVVTSPVVVGPRALTLIVHLEDSITGGTMVPVRVASLPGRHTAAVLPTSNRVATFPARITRAVLPSSGETAELPGRITKVILPSRPTRVSDTEWLDSP